MPSLTGVQVHVDLDGPSGNIFAVLGAARQVLRLACKPAKAVEMTERVHDSKSYQDALAVIGEYVDLVYD